MIVVWGLGEMGGAFAHGYLRAGRRVAPVTRALDPAAVAASTPDPEAVVLAVGEADLGAALARVPAPWADRLALIQNELLPVDWEQAGVRSPTVAVVWFEKKRSKPLNVIRATPVAGPRAASVVEALEAFGVPAARVDDGQLLFELATKNLYILVSNLAGLRVGGTVGALWREHRALARDVAAEVLAIQSWRAGTELPEGALLEAMVAAFEADPEHGCTGRSAPARLARALDHADAAGLRVPTLRALAGAARITPG